MATMSNVRGNAVLRALVAGALGGGLIGILVAAIETFAAVSDTSWHASEGSHLLLYAIVIDALVGCAVGAACIVFLRIVGKLLPRGRSNNISSICASAGASFSFFAFLYLLSLVRTFEPVKLAFVIAAACCMGATLAFAGQSIAQLARQRMVLSVRQLRLLCVAAGLFMSVGTAVLLGARVTCSRVSHAEESATDARMNVVLILIDALRADRLHCYGNERIKTPTLDRLASEGVALRQAFAPASWTRPSVASLFTSLYPLEHGAVSRNPDDCLPDKCVTLAETLSAEGYTTFAVVGNGMIRSSLGFAQGFERWTDAFYIPRRNASLNELIVLQALRHLGSALSFPCDKGLHPRAAEINMELERIIQEGVQTPFFLYLHYMDPHSPYGSPAPFHLMYDQDYTGTTVAMPERPLWLYQVNARHEPFTDVPLTLSKRDVAHLSALYDEDITYVDAYIGEMLEELDKRGLLANTLVVVTSDHGEMFMEHGDLEHGHTLYDEEIHVPLIFWSRKGLPEMIDENSLVSLVDVMPTVLGFAEIRPPISLSGQSLLRKNQNHGSFPARTQQFIFAEQNYPHFRRVVSVTLRTPTDKIVLSKLSPFLLDGSWEEVHFYDLEKDPSERFDIAEIAPERAAEARQRLEAFMATLRKVSETEAQAQEIPPAVRDQLRTLGYIH